MTGIHHQHSHIRLVEYLIALSHPQASQLAFVVNARRINHHHRTQRQQLHGLIYRVRGSPLHIRHHSQVLACNRVQYTGFAGISPPKKSNMYPVRCRRIVHSHGYPLLFPWFLAGLLLVHFRFITNSIPVHYLFTSGSLPVHFRFIACSLPVHCLFTSGLLPVHFRFITGSPPVSCRTDPLLKT